MLRMDGLRTASASSLADARRLLREFQPDAVLLDHMLPDGEGGFMCGELRDSGNGEPLPILLVTGLDPRGLKLGSRDSPDAVLAKPCRPETLTSVLELLVQRRRMAVKSHAARSFRRVRSSACAARSAAPRVRCAPERDAFSARAAAKKARSSLITSSTRSSDWILQPSRFTTDRPYLRFPRPFMAELEPTNVAKRWHLRPWSYTIVENCRARTHRAGRPG
jgi:DNA-binding response OmpR family regulator